MIGVANKADWDWDQCIVCGGAEVQTWGLSLVGRPGNLKVARLGWCHELYKCVEDRLAMFFVEYSEEEAKEFDRANIND